MAVQMITRRGALAAAAMTAAAGLTGCSALGDVMGEGSSGVPKLFDHPSEQEGSGDSDSAPSEREPEPEPSLAEKTLARLTLEQKVAQLFIVTPEQLTGASRATIAGAMTRDALAQIPVGGLCYFSQNIVGNRQLRDLLSGTRELAKASGAGVAPFLTVDEEGGPLVARVANSGCFDVPRYPNMAEIGAAGDAARAAEVGSAIGSYLHDIGFNIDFAPDADVLTNPANPVIGARSFGSDPDLVASMVAAEVEAMLKTGTLPCIKHFPGHGDTAGDSHTGAVYTNRTRAEIESAEFKPFIAGIDAGCPLVMVGHIETPNFAADGLPASLSPTMLTDVLRGQLGFKGTIVSDSFSMGAITQNYSASDAAVRYFQAGGDILLMPQDLRAAYDGVLAAVHAGTLTEARIDESVLRVLSAKETAGLL